jgi:hypothetical protein
MMVSSKKTMSGMSLVGINLNFDRFYVKYVYQSECLNKIIISLSVWILPVDASVDLPETEIWNWTKRVYAVHLVLLI